MVQRGRHTQHACYVFGAVIAADECNPAALDGYGALAFLWCVEYERFSE
jgi:hypothetical protein